MTLFIYIKRSAFVEYDHLHRSSEISTDALLSQPVAVAESLDVPCFRTAPGMLFSVQQVYWGRLKKVGSNVGKYCDAAYEIDSILFSLCEIIMKNVQLFVV